MDEMKKISNTALKVISCFLIVFAVFMMVFTVITVTTVDKNDRSIFGFKFYIVESDSMSRSEKNAHLDVHFNKGDIVLVREVWDLYSLKEGDIISFISQNDDETKDKILTHMIREVKKDDKGELIGFVTFGTHTDVNDRVVVEPYYIQGVYTGKLLWVGTFFKFLKTTPGYIVCILVPFLLLILYNGFNVVRLFRQYKREQTEAMNAEREQLRAEREENQRMMMELMALKERMGLAVELELPDPEASPDAVEQGEAEAETKTEAESASADGET